MDSSRVGLASVAVVGMADIGVVDTGHVERPYVEEIRLAQRKRQPYYVDLVAEAMELYKTYLPSKSIKTKSTLSNLPMWSIRMLMCWNIRRRHVLWTQRRDWVDLARVHRDFVITSNNQSNFIILRSEQQLSVFVPQVTRIVIFDFRYNIAAEKFFLSGAVGLNL